MKENKLYVNGEKKFPIGFKPTMSKEAMNSDKRTTKSQRYSFKMTSYYMLHERLPWQMDAIEFLWNNNMTEARGITFELQKINLKARKLVYKILPTCKLVSFSPCRIILNHSEHGIQFRLK